MGASTPPELYLEPPSFDIELDEFLMLPLRRLRAIHLLREVSVPRVSDESLHQEAHGADADARSLLLHGHSDRAEDAEHRRADWASHFILRLACCGGSSSVVSPEERRLGGGVARRGEEGKDRPGSENGSMAWRKERQEWFFAAEKELFEARLHRHTQCGQGRQAWEGGKGNENGKLDSGRREVAAPLVNERLEALRIVYDLGWLQPEYVDTGQTQTDGYYGGANGISAGDSGFADGLMCDANGSAETRKRRRRDPPKDEAGSPTSTNNANVGDPLPSDASKGLTREQLRPRYLACPFEKVLHLVRSREVLLRDGKALLVAVQVPGAVVQHFGESLKQNMAVAERALPGVEADERVANILRQVRKEIDAIACGGTSLHPAGNRSSVGITSGNIDQVAAKHFPLCMRRTLDVLRTEHHLKYEARIQLVSFLGNAGMKVEELLALWREEFPRGMPPDEYARKQKQYEYSVRHMYGLEGKRKAYNPQSCARIASIGWGSGEGGLGHGCPFLSHQRRRRIPIGEGDGSGGGGGGGGSVVGGQGDGNLRGMLSARNLPAADIEDIVGPLEAGSDWQARGADGGSSSKGKSCRGWSAVGACRRHFSVTHRWASGGGEWLTAGADGDRHASPNGWLAASTRPRSESFLTQNSVRVELN